MRKRPFFFLLLSGLVLTLITTTMSSCSQSPTKGGKAGIEPGSPAFFWAAAKDAQSRGDFAAAAENLRRLTTGKDKHEYRERAEVWLMTVSAGMARGEMAWADALRDGVKLARDKQADFRKAISTVSSDANQHAMQYVEVAHAAMDRGLPAPEITVAFVMPALDAKAIDADPGKIAKGILPPAAELDGMRQQYVRREVMLAMARASGSGTDLDKAKAALAGGDLKLKTETWRLTMARELVNAAEFYSPKKLDHPGRAKVMLDEAKEAIAPLPATSAEVKEIRKQMDAVAKKVLKPTS